MSKTSGYIVLFDDRQGLSIPMGEDPECPGAIQCMSASVTIFKDRAAARKAIRISAAKARLDKEQGKPANDDFLEARKHLRIVPLKPLP